MDLKHICFRCGGHAENPEGARHAACSKCASSTRLRRKTLRSLYQRRVSTARDRARALGMKGHFSVGDIYELRRLQRGKCAKCRKSIGARNFHCDHIYPLSKGGANTADNIQLLCPKCNLAKSDSVPCQ